MLWTSCRDGNVSYRIQNRVISVVPLDDAAVLQVDGNLEVRIKVNSNATFVSLSDGGGVFYSLSFVKGESEPFDVYRVNRGNGVVLFYDESGEVSKKQFLGK